MCNRRNRQVNMYRSFFKHALISSRFLFPKYHAEHIEGFQRMTVKIKHCLVVPRASAVIFSGILRVIIGRIAARPAASELLPDRGVVRCRLADRNPCAFPVEYAKCACLACRRADIAHHACLSLNRRRITVNQIIDTDKAVGASVAIL